MEFVRHKTKHELLRARDWESGWIAGEYIGRNRTLVTPTREEREVIYLRETFDYSGSLSEADVCGRD